jgi:hypothetical protein
MYTDSLNRRFREFWKLFRSSTNESVHTCEPKSQSVNGESLGQNENGTSRNRSRSRSPVNPSQTELQEEHGEGYQIHMFGQAQRPLPVNLLVPIEPRPPINVVVVALKTKEQEQYQEISLDIHPSIRDSFCEENLNGYPRQCEENGTFA